MLVSPVYIVVGIITILKSMSPIIRVQVKASKMFVIHVENSYDYTYESDRRDELVKIIESIYVAKMKRSLVVAVFANERQLETVLNDKKTMAKVDVKKVVMNYPHGHNSQLFSSSLGSFSFNGSYASSISESSTTSFSRGTKKDSSNDSSLSPPRRSRRLSKLREKAHPSISSLVRKKRYNMSETLLLNPPVSTVEFLQVLVDASKIAAGRGEKHVMKTIDALGHPIARRKSTVADKVLRRSSIVAATPPNV